MGRPKGSTTKPKSNNQSYNTPIQSPQQTQTPSQFAEDFATRYLNQYVKFIENFASVNSATSGTGYYNPIYANSAMKRFNTYSNKPSMRDLISWLDNPRYFEQQLRGLSDWLTFSCEFYTRTIYYAANILNFDYELIPINPPASNATASEIDLYKRQKYLNNDWLRKFRVKEQCSNIMLDVIKSGGKFYYLRHSDTSDYLQNMPDDYLYINGRVDTVGYTYSMNMSFFYQFPESVFGFAPEFADWYKNFLTPEGKFDNTSNPYKRMPIDRSVVFKFDDTRPENIPPFAGIFKNALEIEDYQDLLKLKAQLQTFQMLYLEIPKDKDGKPTITANESINYVAVAQTQVPTGTGIVSSPMHLEQIDFDNSQNFNNIIGLGASNFYQSSGLCPAIFGDSTKSAVGIINSIQTDYLMFEHMYNQFERFINYQLTKISGKYDFAIKFLRRSNYTLSDDITNAFKLLDHGGAIGRTLSALGAEPWQHENTLLDNVLCGYTDLLRVPQTAYTQSSSSSDSGGRPTSEQAGTAITDSNDITRSAGSNQDKFSAHKCLNCGKELDSNNSNGMFCSDDCKLEWATSIVDENKDDLGGE
jgi:hypothetical protein